MSTTTARFSGTCQACRGTFSVGDKITWSRKTGARHTPENCSAQNQKVRKKS
jgi:hypothetical protein